jgi:murein L,D-transpeptidase YcbB/YkuD
VVKIKARLLSSVMLTLLVMAGCGVERRVAVESDSAAGPVATHQRLSAAGEASFRALIETGNLADLRWPNFVGYRTDVKKFYEADGYTLAWVRDQRPTSQALGTIRCLQNADIQGLNAADYDGPRWVEHLAMFQLQDERSSEMELASFDLAVTVSVMRYVSDLHIGRVNPRRLHVGPDVEHTNYNLPVFLRSNIVNAPDVTAALHELEPPFSIYSRTQKALDTYARLAAEDDGEPLPDTKRAVEPGEPYQGVARLEQLLRRLGDLPNGATASANSIYRGALVDAVKHFQQRHGLEPDGRIGKDTIRQLNVPLTHRVEQLRFTLERLRWLPHQFVEPPIVVNIPEFKLRAFDDQYRPALTMKVVVGKAYHWRTPVFAQEMKYVVFRPYWDIPLSIQRTELISEIEEDPGYLSRHAYVIVDSHDYPVSEAAAGEDLLQQLDSGSLAVRQKPGPNNSLGLVKFVFPNEHNVYMHGTPAMQLFAKSRRDFSHGCIRLEQPEELAVWVLRSKRGWTRERIRAAMQGNSTMQVNLERPIPVLILYATAIVLENDEVHFFDDLYGHDAALERALADRARGVSSDEAVQADYQRRTRPTSTWTKSELR